MDATIFEESVITHTDTIEIVGGKAKAVEFRVNIRFQDMEGRTWAIDRVFKAVPQKED